MLVDIVYKKDGLWSITAQEGMFEGEEIAEVEAVNLNDVLVLGSILNGKLIAIHGATIPDHIYEDAWTIRRMGIGSTFRPPKDVYVESPADQFSTLDGSRFKTAKLNGDSATFEN